jgi:hypothetical protein
LEIEDSRLEFVNELAVSIFVVCAIVFRDGRVFSYHIDKMIVRRDVPRKGELAGD